MSRYLCDLHIHSCLSPCADDDMTPGNIAGMAVLNGLQIVALTDHNTCRNCPAFFHHAKSFGLIPIPGMELTTAEDIHVLCLFPTLEGAMDFDAYVDTRRPHIKNEVDFFGHQYLTDEQDEIVGEEDNLLLHASSLSLEEAHAEVTRRGGVCYPAHIDRAANGMIEILGDFPPEPPYTAYELNGEDSRERMLQRFPMLSSLVCVASSDAHRLTDIREEGFPIELADEPYSSERVRTELIKTLRGRCSDG